ncbi:MAG TPA: tetratricopeptide repeat protein [Candidatus Saccharimonadales bacterium]|jgi:tetratricopeptide (TPR) repeat protein|nr:tetratricopeptide repeat protein [Candidatus Saccharimonadales bacterium]
MKSVVTTIFLCLLTTGATAQTGAPGVPTLDQAGAAADAGHSAEAIEMYRALLQREPENAVALGSISDLLQAKGEWREATPFLERLVVVQPHNAPSMYQLGRILSWQAGKRAQALDLLHRACGESGHNPEYCTAYGDVLSWKPADRDEAVRQLQAVVETHPEQAVARVKLAQMLSWATSTRPRALQLFAEGLQRDPQNKELLMASAEVLSWSRETRSEALAQYERVLERYPEEPRALTGKAQLLAWQGRSQESLAIYQHVLAKDPGNTAALQGAAEILNWKGRYKEARVLAQQAREAEPSSAAVALTLARADIGLKKYAEARGAIRSIDGTPGPEFDQARQEIRRGAGTYIETGFSTRAERGELDFYRFDTAISTQLGPANRATFVYQPTLWDARERRFNSSYFGTNLDTEMNDNLTTHFQIGAEVFNNVPVNLEGGAGVRYKPSSSTAVKLAFDREPVQESLLSTRGDSAGGVLFGQVRSNLGSVGFSYENAAHKYDLSLGYTDGVYTGRALDSNRRYSLQGQVGKALRSQGPYLRVAYGVDYTSFDHDADHQAGQTLSSVTGGYFSPTRFLLNQAIISAAHRFSDKLQWNASGTAGVQNVETGPSNRKFTSTQLGASFQTNVYWRAAATEELRFGYEYLNVYNAFQRNLFRFSWRHYF